MESFDGKCTASHNSMVNTRTSRHHHHHHHHHHPFPLCPHHHHHYHHHHYLCDSCILKPHSLLPHKHNFHPYFHFHFCPSFSHHPPPTISQKPETDPTVCNNPRELNFNASGFKDDEASEAHLLQEEFIEEEDGEEPIYVMTDEWAEFFAKSEEKRRLEKKQAKKKNKKKGLMHEQSN